MSPWGKDEGGGRGCTHTSEETTGTRHRWLVLPCPLPALEFRSLEGRCKILSAMHLGQTSAWHTVGACSVRHTTVECGKEDRQGGVSQERCVTMSADKCQ